MEKTAANPLMDLPVEKVTDLGPYFDLLTEDQQRKARGDWFQADTLNKVVAQLESFRLVDSDSKLGSELVCLAAL